MIDGNARIGCQINQKYDEKPKDANISFKLFEGGYSPFQRLERQLGSYFETKGIFGRELFESKHQNRGH